MTAREVVLAAFATSRHNDADTIDDEAGALLAILNDEIGRIFDEGGQINRRFFGATYTVPFASGGWARPSEAATIVRLEHGGTELVELPLDQRHIEVHRQAVYSWGQQWISRGLSGVDPTSGNVTVFATRLPTTLTDLDDEIDSALPDRFTTLLKWPLAIYLAQKDGDRDGEVAAFTTQLERANAQFKQFLAGESQAEVREYGYGGPK